MGSFNPFRSKRAVRHRNQTAKFFDCGFHDEDQEENEKDQDGDEVDRDQEGQHINAGHPNSEKSCSAPQVGSEIPASGAYVCSTSDGSAFAASTSNAARPSQKSQKSRLAVPERASESSSHPTNLKRTNEMPPVQSRDASTHGRITGQADGIAVDTLSEEGLERNQTSNLTKNDGKSEK